MKKFKKGFILEPAAGDDFTYDFTSEFVALSKMVSSGEYEISAELYDVGGEQIAVTAPVLFSFHVPVEVPVEIVDEEEIAESLGVDIDPNFCAHLRFAKEGAFGFRKDVLLFDGTRVDDAKIAFKLSGERLQDYELEVSLVTEDGRAFLFTSAVLAAHTLVAQEDGSFLLVLSHFICDELGDGADVVRLDASLLRYSDKHLLTTSEFLFRFDPLLPLSTPEPPTEEVPGEEVSRGVSRVHIMSPVDTAAFVGSDLHKGLLPLTDTTLEVAARDVPLKATVLWYVVRGKKALTLKDVAKVYRGKRKPVGLGTSLEWDCNYRERLKKPYPKTFTLLCVVVSGREKTHGDIVGWNYLVLTDPMPKMPVMKILLNYPVVKTLAPRDSLLDRLLSGPDPKIYYYYVLLNKPYSSQPVVATIANLSDFPVGFSCNLYAGNSYSGEPFSEDGRFLFTSRFVTDLFSSYRSTRLSFYPAFEGKTISFWRLPFAKGTSGPERRPDRFQTPIALGPIATKSGAMPKSIRYSCDENSAFFRFDFSKSPDFSSLIPEEEVEPPVVDESEADRESIDSPPVGRAEDFAVLGVDENRFVFLDEPESADIAYLLEDEKK